MHASTLKPKEEITLSTPMRYGVSVILAMAATFLLFTGMLMLIQFSYQERDTPEASIIDAIVDKPIKAIEDASIIAKLQEETKKLKQPVALPPAVATKTSFRSPLPPRKSANRVAFTPSFNATLPVDLSANFRPAVAPYGQNNRRRTGTSGTRKGFGDTAGIGGERQCTIIFQVGVAIGDIDEFQWIDCLNSTIVDETEAALYEWVGSQSASYLKLNPKAGDSIEFTYEQK